MSDWALLWIFPSILSFHPFRMSYMPHSQGLSPAPGLFFQAWMGPIKSSTWVWGWGWPAGDQSWWWGAPGRPNPVFLPPGWGTAWGGSEWWVGGVGRFCQVSWKKKMPSKSQIFWSLRGTVVSIFCRPSSEASCLGARLPSCCDVPDLIFFYICASGTISPEGALML